MKTRAFVLPLVMLLALVAASALVILFTRRSSSMLASERQSDNYVSHHFQSGLRDLVTVVLQTAQRRRDSHLTDGVLAFDVSLEQGLRMEVRLIDAQGSVLASRDPSDSIRLSVMRKAAARLIEGGLTDERYLRGSGAAKVSLHGAPREVLSALARAVDEECDGESFADAVIAERTQNDITQAKVRVLATTGKIAADKVELLEQMVVTEPTLWWARARVLDSSGKEIFAQGGLMQGALKRGSGFTASAWTAVSWGPIPQDGLLGFRFVEASRSR